MSDGELDGTVDLDGESVGASDGAGVTGAGATGDFVGPNDG